MHTGPDPEIAAGPSGHDHGVNLAVGAGAVVAAEITCVGRGLVEVGLARGRLALEFQDDDGTADQQDDVGAPRLERQLVLEDGGVARRALVRRDDLPHLRLQLGDGVVPRADLLRRRVRDERLQAAANHLRGGRAEDREVRGPTVAGGAVDFAHHARILERGGRIRVGLDLRSRGVPA